jgi:sec-independent protein translocase protein TatB
MFNHVGWGEMLVLAVVGLVVLGPERLPKAAADAAKWLRQLRTLARNATQDIKAELGPEMADLDLASLHPRRIVNSLWDEEDDRAIPAQSPGPPTRAYVPLSADEKPPYDADAT